MQRKYLTYIHDIVISILKKKSGIIVKELEGTILGSNFMINRPWAVLELGVRIKDRLPFQIDPWRKSRHPQAIKEVENLLKVYEMATRLVKCLGIAQLFRFENLIDYFNNGNNIFEDNIIGTKRQLLRNYLSETVYNFAKSNYHRLGMVRFYCYYPTSILQIVLARFSKEKFSSDIDWSPVKGQNFFYTAKAISNKIINKKFPKNILNKRH